MLGATPPQSGTVLFFSLLLLSPTPLLSVLATAGAAKSVVYVDVQPMIDPSSNQTKCSRRARDIRFSVDPPDVLPPVSVLYGNFL